MLNCYTTGSYQTGQDRISKPATVCSTKTARQRHPQVDTRNQRTTSCISRRVSSISTNPIRRFLIHVTADEANRTYSSLLRSEMFDNEIPQSIPQHAENGLARAKTPPANLTTFPIPNLTPSTPHKNLFNYSSPAHLTPSLTPRSHSRSERGPNLNARSEIYSLSPVKYESQKMLLSPRKTPRAVSKVPYKVLDAPELADDFYLNLVDWGSQGVLAVGLGNAVYLWNSESGQVRELFKLQDDHVTSVSWIQRVCHPELFPTK